MDTSLPALPVYEVEEVPLERRLKAGKYYIIVDGKEIEFERRKNNSNEAFSSLKKTSKA